MISRVFNPSYNTLQHLTSTAALQLTAMSIKFIGPQFVERVMHVKKVEKTIVTKTANSTTDRLQIQLDSTDSTDTTANMQPTGSLSLQKQNGKHVSAYIYQKKSKKKQKRAKHSKQE